MNKLPFVKKFILVSVFFSLPIFVLSTALFIEVNHNLSVSKEELRGIEVIQTTYELLYLSHYYRDFRMIQRVKSQSNISKEITETEKNIDNSIQQLKLSPYITSRSTMSDQINKLDSSWNTMKFSSAGAAGGPNIQYQFYEVFVKEVERLLKSIAYNSKLVHDPDLETFLLINLLINTLPDTLDKLGYARGYGTYALSLNAIDYETFKTFDKIYDDLQSNHRLLTQSLAFTLNENQVSDLDSNFNTLISSSSEASKYFYTHLIEKDFITEKWTNYFKIITNHLNDFRQSSENLIPIIHHNISNRIEREWFKLLGITIGTLILTLIIFYLFSGMYVSIALVSKSFINKAKQVASGDLSVHLDIRSNDELSQLYIAFNDMVKQLKENQEHILQAEKMASLGSMIAGVAHEMNTPLGIGTTAVSKLKEDLNRVDTIYKDGMIKRADLEDYLRCGHEGLSLIEANMQRCAKLINSFKQLSFAQTQTEQESIDIIPIIKNVISPTGILNISPSIDIELNAEEEIMVNVDPDLLSLILVNIISNILQHAFPNHTGRIIISAEKINGKLYLDIADNGIGISDEDLEQIFEPFYTTRRHHGYVGLGLHIVYVILTQALHGTIKVESSPNNGAHFKIELDEFNPYYVQKNELSD